MKNIVSILFLVLSFYSYSTECDKLKHEILYHSNTSSTSANTNELLNRLSVCEMDNYDIALISNPEFFMQVIDELTKDNADDVIVEDLITHFSDFKKTQLETYLELRNQIKQVADYYDDELTTNILDRFIGDWAKNNGEEIALELKNYSIGNNLIDNDHSIKFVLNEFYSNKYNTVVFNDNLNSISWQTNSSESLGQEIDKKSYEERIKISSSKNESHVIIEVELAKDWNIYSIEKETINMFKATIFSQNSCLDISELTVTNESLVSDPMGMNGDVKVISGTSAIKIPIQAKCTDPILIEFTFTLVNNDGLSVPFIKEMIEIK